MTLQFTPNNLHCSSLACECLPVKRTYSRPGLGLCALPTNRADHPSIGGGGGGPFALIRFDGSRAQAQQV